MQGCVCLHPVKNFDRSLRTLLGVMPSFSMVSPSFREFWPPAGFWTMALYLLPLQLLRVF